MIKTNLYEETVDDLKSLGKDIVDVNFVTDGNFSCSIKDFLNKARDFNYDSDYGTPEVNMCLKIVGDGWWLERAEYDGSEHWSMKITPKLKPYGDIELKNWIE